MENLLDVSQEALCTKQVSPGRLVVQRGQESIIADVPILHHRTIEIAELHVKALWDFAG